jgi:hypothetical protein
LLVLEALALHHQFQERPLITLVAVVVVAEMAHLLLVGRAAMAVVAQVVITLLALLVLQTLEVGAAVRVLQAAVIKQVAMAVQA